MQHFCLLPLALMQQDSRGGEEFSFPCLSMQKSAISMALRDMDTTHQSH